MRNLNIGRWHDMRRIFACGLCALLLAGLFPISGHSLDRDWRKVGWERVSLPDTQDDVPWVDNVDDPVGNGARADRQQAAVSSPNREDQNFSSMLTFRLLISFFVHSNPSHQTESNHVEISRHSSSR